jgi:hypothetical protein
MASKEVTLMRWVCTCERCSHAWLSRSEDQPLSCPSCHSATWNRTAARLNPRRREETRTGHARHGRGVTATRSNTVSLLLNSCARSASDGPCRGRIRGDAQPISRTRNNRIFLGVEVGYQPKNMQNLFLVSSFDEVGTWRHVPSTPSATAVGVIVPSGPSRSTTTSTAANNAFLSSCFVITHNFLPS